MWTCHFPHVCWTLIVGFTSPQHPVLLLRFYITLLALIRGTRDTEVGRMFRSHMIPLCLLFYLSFKVHHALPQKKPIQSIPRIAGMNLASLHMKTGSEKDRLGMELMTPISVWGEAVSPIFPAVCFTGVQLGPRANEIPSHLRHWQPARPKRKTMPVRIMRGMPCKCGCKNPRNIQPIQSYLLDKDSEMLELGVRKYMILPIHEHMCQNMLDFHTSSKSSIHAAWAPNIVPNERGTCGLPLNLLIQTDAIPSPSGDPKTLQFPPAYSTPLTRRWGGPHRRCGKEFFTIRVMDGYGGYGPWL